MTAAITQLGSALRRSWRADVPRNSAVVVHDANLCHRRGIVQASALPVAHCQHAYSRVGSDLFGGAICSAGEEEDRECNW